MASNLTSGGESYVDELILAAETGDQVGHDFPPDPADPEHEAAAAVARLLARIRTGDWLDAQLFPPLVWTVPGVVPEGFGLLVGPPKLGKSWFALGVGLAAACGGRALGRLMVTGRGVLYAALEDGDRRMQDRCRQLLDREPIPAAFSYFTAATPAEILPIISAWLDCNAGGLVILDTLGKVMPAAMPGESAYSRDHRIGGALKAITARNPGCTLLVVHHTRKGTGPDWMDSTSGTQGLNGSADFTLLLERARGEGAALLRVTGRDVIESDYAMTGAPVHWAIDGRDLAEAAQNARDAAVTTGVGDRMAEVVRTVNRTVSGLRAEQVAEELGIDKDSAGRYLRRAVEAGRIERAGRGLYTPLSEVSGCPVGEADNLPFPSAGFRTIGQPDTTDTGVEALQTEDPPPWDEADQ